MDARVSLLVVSTNAPCFLKHSCKNEWLGETTVARRDMCSAIIAGHKEQIIYIKFCFNLEKPAFETHGKALCDDIIRRTQTCEQYSCFVRGHTSCSVRGHTSCFVRGHTSSQDFEHSGHISPSWTHQKSVSNHLCVHTVIMLVTF